MQNNLLQRILYGNRRPKHQRGTMLFCFQWLLDKCFLAKSLQPLILISFLIIPWTITNFSDNYFLLLNLSKVNKKKLQSFRRVKKSFLFAVIYKLFLTYLFIYLLSVNYHFGISEALGVSFNTKTKIVSFHSLISEKATFRYWDQHICILLLLNIRKKKWRVDH